MWNQIHCRIYLSNRKATIAYIILNHAKFSFYFQTLCFEKYLKYLKSTEENTKIVESAALNLLYMLHIYPSIKN